jgi:hypothetical protein
MQIYICKERPDLIKHIELLTPTLQLLFGHELNLSDIEI